MIFIKKLTKLCFAKRTGEGGLLKNNVSYDAYVFAFTAKTENLENMKWVFENKFQRTK